MNNSLLDANFVTNIGTLPKTINPKSRNKLHPKTMINGNRSNTLEVNK